MTTLRAALHDVMTHRAFAVTWDYRCPFARNAHEHVIDALAAGVDWDVTFVPFSLGQVHVQEGQPDVWDDPGSDSGLLALQAGVVVRDKFADRFLTAHRALFALRHDEGGHLRDPDAVRATLERADVDANAVFEEIASGRPLQTVREEHTAYASSHSVWGVPTFVHDDQAVFVRLMNRPHGDAELATTTIERVVDLLAWPELNEFKHTSIPR